MELLKRIQAKALGLVSSAQQGLAQVASNPLINQVANSISAGRERIANMDPRSLWFPTGVQQVNTGIAPVDTLARNTGSFIQNRYVDPIANIPNAVNQLATPGQRLQGGLGVAGGAATLFPGPEDLVLPLYDTLKGYSAAKQRGSSTEEALARAGRGLTGEEYTGLGSAVTTDPTGELIGNIAELPATVLLAGGVKSKNLDENVKAVSRAVKEGKMTFEEGQTLLKSKGFKFPYESGDIKKLEEPLYETLGVSKSGGKNYKNDFGQLQGAKEQLQYYVDEGDDVAKLYLNKVNDLENELELARRAKGGESFSSIYGKPDLESTNRETSNKLVESINRYFASKKSNTATFIADDKGRLTPVTKGGRRTEELFKSLQPTELPSSGQVRQLPSGVLRDAVDVAAVPKDVKMFPDQFGKKLGTYQKATQEPYRAFPKLFGKNWERVKPVFDELDYSKAKAVDFKKKYISQIQGAVPFKIGSNEDKLLAKYGSGDITLPELEKMVGPERAQGIVKADQAFRQVYDSIFNEVNALRQTEGLPEIPYRKNYYRETGATDTGFIESFLSGGGKKISSASIFKPKEGKQTSGALEGFADYIERSAQAGFIDSFGAKFDTLSKTLRDEKAPSNVTKYLEDWNRSQIKGEINTLGDTGIEKVLNVVDNLGKTVRANKVLGNLSSLMSQTLNLPSAVADVGVVSTIKGATNFTSNIKIVSDLPFIKERSFRTPLSLTKGPVKKGKAILGAALQEADVATAKVIGSMYLEKAKALGFEGQQAIKWASDQTRKSMGGRGVGDFAPIQTSRLGQFIAPFTLEVQNGINKLGDFVDERKVGSLVGYFAMAHGINAVYEKITGYAPLPDPIATAQDMYKSAVGTDEKEQSWLKVAGRAITGALEFNPIAQNTLALAYPVVENMFKDGEGNSLLPNSRDVFGSDDPTRFGSAKMYADAVRSPKDFALNFLTPFGGNQIRKTTEGLAAGERGYTESRAGNVLHSVDQDPLTKTQMAVFGQWSTPESQKYFENEFNRPLTKTEKEKLASMSPEAAKEYISNIQQQNQTENKVAIKETKLSILGKLFSNEKEPPKVDAIKTKYFEGKDVKSVTTITDKKKIFTSLNKAMKDETLPEEYKQKVMEASGVSEDEFKYYQMASMSKEDRRSGLVEIANGSSSKEEFLDTLVLSKRTVAGNAIAGNQDFEYLYDQGYITKEEKKMLNAVRYDELKNEFYWDRDYKGSGSGEGALTPAKRRAMITRINSIFKETTRKRPKTDLSASVTSSSTPEVKIPTLAVRSNKTKDRWFKSY